MCGIFGAFNCPKAAEVTYVGLHEMQSRAKEYAGITTCDGRSLYREAGPGIVQTVFSQERLSRLFGRTAIGHIRYATVDDDPTKDNAQPLLDPEKKVAICHNGNLTNTKDLRCQLCEKTCQPKTPIDTELILLRFCESSQVDLFKRTFEALRGVCGTYSLLILFGNAMIAARDPYGNRPLWLGSKDGGWFVSSETVSFQNLGIKTEREIEPGEILVIDKSGPQSMYFDEDQLSENPIPHELAKCIFELLYYASPASQIFGLSVVEFRLRAGQLLHDCHPAPGQIVLGIPDSANFHAFGYALYDSELRYVPGIMRSHYIGRTFVEGLQKIRIDKVSLKFTPLAALLAGQIVVLIDDSIVRLTTMPRVAELLRMVGVKEIHVRIATPKIKFPCRYGIDTPTRKELVASDHTAEEIRNMAGVDSLSFLEVEQLRTLVPDPQDYCFACMTGDYPIPIPDYS